ncbi:hypothetical protein C5167_032522 [Papaver somniferum]|uniref:Phosphotransferase n=1 Tax=Papaver somniferum TaxID=3469 RepID=A0A4Y7KAK9_PAPSO|nr:hypothetical protein C5167_032522 [Papaver somniferum]
MEPSLTTSKGAEIIAVKISLGLILLPFELRIKLQTQVNDTVGTLALGHFHDKDTLAAVIIGTGANASYVERTDAIIKTQGLLTNSGGMVIYQECGESDDMGAEILIPCKMCKPPAKHPYVEPRTIRLMVSVVFSC